MNLTTRHRLTSCLAGLRRAAAAALGALALLTTMGAPAAAATLPPASFEIRNRAEASYVVTGHALPETLHSNVVSARVAAVEALRLDADQTLNRSPGAPLALSHVLTNTGNVASGYRFTLEAADAASAAIALRLVHDLDGNGIADPGEPELALAAGSATLSLAPGQAAALLLVGRLPATGVQASAAAAAAAATGSAPSALALVRWRFSAVAVAVPVAGAGMPVGHGAAAAQATVTDTVRIGHVAALVLAKRADQAGRVAPGTEVRYTITATNTGDAAATAGQAFGEAATPLRIDGQPAALLLLRDLVPEGLRYVPGSLAGGPPGAWRLFRLPGDAPFSYRRNGDDAGAIEVAIGLPAGTLRPNATLAMQLALRAEAAPGAARVNRAEAFFDDGSGAAASLSNPVAVQVATQRLGLALRADVPRIERDAASGRLLGTALVRLSWMLQNFGPETAHTVQVRSPLSGADTSFGRAAPAALPSAGEYQVLPDSARVAWLRGSGTLSVDPAFTGSPGQDRRDGLLAAGGTLGPDALAEVSVTVRVNVGGRDMRVLLSADAEGHVGQPAHTALADASVDGSEPDANGDGDAANDRSPTPVAFSAPGIALVKTAGVPRRLDGAARRYEVDYALTVTNTGTSVATYVQVADNLECAFRTGSDQPPVRSWRLVGAPVFADAALEPNPGYTGSAACSTPPGVDGDPFAVMPRAASVMLTNGSRHLAPGQSAQIRYTVQFELEPLLPASARVFLNLAVAGVYDRSSIGSANAARPGTARALAAPGEQAAGALLAAATSAAHIAPGEPSGVVYNAATRAPVAGAVVTLLREACVGSAATPINAEELDAAPGAAYRFNADGSVSMSTGDDGRYRFQLRMPPVSATCDYRLRVTPPARAGLSWPSKTLPARDGAAPGGAVQPQSAPPTGAATTAHHLLLTLGPDRPDVWNNHLPLDTAVRPGDLLVEKTGDRRALQIGEAVDYRVRVRNVAGTTLTSLEVTDQLPGGFRLVPGSVRLDGQPAADPVQGDGALRFSWPALVLADGREVVLAYRAVAGITTPLGTAVNRARARSGDRQSNEAAWSVRVAGGVFGDEAFVFGKVYLDCNRNGVQDAPGQGGDAGATAPAEYGVPGIRLLLEDGTGVITDAEGKFSLYGLRAITHVLKLDTTTLPAGARLAVLDDRHAGRGDSRFVDLKKGEFHQADFAIAGCDGPGVHAAVERRRQALATRPDAEGEAVSRARLDLQAPAAPTEAQLRGRAARGAIGPGGTKQDDATATVPAPASSSAAAVFEALPTGVAERPASGSTARVELETLLGDADRADRAGEADAEPGFIDLKDGDTLPSALVDVRVRGALGSTLRLSVDGQTVSEQRVGKRVRLAERGFEAWEYIGVALQPGSNRLQLDVLDGFGNVRANRTLSLVAPGRLAHIEIDAPSSAVADPGTPVRVTVRLVDERGVSVTARTPLTLETSRGRWTVRDLNPTEAGTQVFIEGGRAELMLVPPNEPLDALLRVSSGVLVGERSLAFLPELRPLVGAGVLEGVIDLRRGGALALDGHARDTFEQSLRELSHDSADGRTRTSARAAFFFKGTVRGDLLLTAAFDSDKATRERLFRDIQPDQFYPIYGDAAVKTFDAQSTQRLYLRVDRQKSYLLYGDFSTAAEADATGAADPRRLSQNARAATGLKAHHEDGRMAVTATLSHDNLKQAVLEFPADGTSGPYTLPGSGEWVAGSERVEVLVRDRRQPGVVLSTTLLTRFADYVIEPMTRRLLFTAPVASLDENLNTRHLRVRFETETGGAAFYSGGVDLQFKATEALQLGASVQHDGNPDNPATLAGVTAVARLGERSTLVGELARSDSALADTGHAARLEWQHAQNGLSVRAQASRADRDFDNLAAGLARGRTEASAQATAQLGTQHALRAEAVYSADALTGARTRGAQLALSSALAEGVQGEIGLRSAARRAGAAAVPGLPVTAAAAGAAPALNATADAGSADGHSTSLRGRVTLRPSPTTPGQVYVEAEQDLQDANARVLAVGGERQLVEKTRLYGRYELVSSLGNPYALGSTAPNHLGVVGIETALLDSGRLFNEYRLRDALDGREGQLASGARSSWTLAEGLRVGAGVERTSAFGGQAGQRATAVTGQLDYTGQPHLRLHAGLEARSADTGDSWLGTLGLSYKLDRDWSLLARSAVSLQEQAAASSRTLLSRQQLGLAWRQVDTDRWNGLARYEYQLQRTQGGTTAGEQATQLLSLHLNHRPRRDLVLTGRLAAKWRQEQQRGIGQDFSAQLLYARATWDLAPGWDLSLQTAWRQGDGQRQRALGLEVGLQAVDNLWLSLGFNARGLADSQLAGGEHTEAGLFLRLRFKFDESLFQ